MWRKILSRAACGYCITVTATLVASLISALCGAEYLCMPDFAGRVGGEFIGFILQTLLMGLIGLAFSAGSAFFEIDRWSFLQQGAAHLALTLAVWIAVELICFTPLTVPVVVSFLLSAAATYTITWTVQYFVWRAQVRQLDARIRMKNEEYTP